MVHLLPALLEARVEHRVSRIGDHSLPDLHHPGIEYSTSRSSNRGALATPLFC
jgi:hypothetical protein